MLGFSTRLGWLMSADELTKCTFPFDLSLVCTAQTMWWASQIVWGGLCQQTIWPGPLLPYFVLFPVEGVMRNNCVCRVCCSPLSGATRLILRLALTKLSCGNPFIDCGVSGLLLFLISFFFFDPLTFSFRDWLREWTAMFVSITKTYKLINLSMHISITKNYCYTI